MPVSGTKALYGHPLGASGAIEAAICALAIRDGWAPASINLRGAGPGRRRAAAGPAAGRARRHLPARAVDVVRVRRAERRARLRRAGGLRAGGSRGRGLGNERSPEAVAVDGRRAVRRRGTDRVRPARRTHTNAPIPTTSARTPPTAIEIAIPKTEAMPPMSGPPIGVEPAKIVV